MYLVRSFAVRLCKGIIFAKTSFTINVRAFIGFQGHGKFVGLELVLMEVNLGVRLTLSWSSGWGRSSRDGPVDRKIYGLISASELKRVLHRTWRSLSQKEVLVWGMSLWDGKAALSLRNFRDKKKVCQALHKWFYIHGWTCRGIDVGVG